MSTNSSPFEEAKIFMELLRNGQLAQRHVNALAQVGHSSSRLLLGLEDLDIRESDQDPGWVDWQNYLRTVERSGLRETSADSLLEMTVVADEVILSFLDRNSSVAIAGHRLVDILKNYLTTDFCGLGYVNGIRLLRSLEYDMHLEGLEFEVWRAIVCSFMGTLIGHGGFSEANACFNHAYKAFKIAGDDNDGSGGKVNDFISQLTKRLSTSIIPRFRNEITNFDREQIRLFLDFLILERSDIYRLLAA